MESKNQPGHSLTWAVVIGAASAAALFFSLFFLLVALFPPGPFGGGEFLSYPAAALVAIVAGVAVGFLVHRRLVRRAAPS